MNDLKYGPETATVEAFIQHLKAMTPEQWAAAGDAAGDAAGAAAGVAARVAAWAAAGVAARAAAGVAARVAAWAAAGVAARAAAWVAARAADEIQGAALMRERRRPFFFLPMFGFNSPEDIPIGVH
jgi:hypothetical protein